MWLGEFLIVGVGAGLWAWTKSWPFIALGFAGMVAFDFWVRNPIVTVERKARALRRRAANSEMLVADVATPEST